MSNLELLAHRGLWKARDERNSPAAFELALANGFGIETDLRDYRGTLVISHDMPNGTEQTVDEFLATYRQLNSTSTLALNIKADGLAKSLQDLLSQYQIENYFCFDMSVPDSLDYFKRGLRTFVRRSEYEPPSSLLDRAAGVWMDAFESEWYSEEEVSLHLQAGRDVCIVSPELHGRPHEPFWNEMLNWRSLTTVEQTAATEQPVGRLLACTDFPLQFLVQA